MFQEDEILLKRCNLLLFSRYFQIKIVFEYLCLKLNFKRVGWSFRMIRYMDD